MGLGYVGCVSAACLAASGHRVIGVDVNPVKVESIRAGLSPIVERGLGELIAEQVASGCLIATTSTREAVAASNLSLVCVGTPSRSNGSLDLTYLENVCREIGEALAELDRDRPSDTPPHLVIIRSTMVPGTVEKTVVPALEASSGGKLGVMFQVATSPEFLREAKSLEDYANPPFIVIGANDAQTAVRVLELYAEIQAPVFQVPVRTAEMVKYSCNLFHALKVGFANEIGNLCKGADIDGTKVMEILCEDRKLNLSPYYMRPGFAFGGSCLPKDLRAILSKARELDVEVPILSSILPSNALQVERAVNAVLDHGRKRIGMLGLSFKAGTDDLRESPMVTLVERLIGRGLDVKIYDRDVALARLGGANKIYIEREIPHIDRLLSTSLAEVCGHAEVLVVGTGTATRAEIEPLLREDHFIYDLTRLWSRSSGHGYEGICW